MTTHETYINLHGQLCLHNADDTYYEQVFNGPGDFFAFVADLIAQGNAHYGTVARLVHGATELNISQLDLDGVHAAGYTWADFKVANQQALDDIAAALGVDR